MLEIFVILLLPNINARIAERRGRKPGPFRGMTYLMWFGGEALGLLIGVAVMGGFELTAYLFAIGLAIVGGIASVIIAKTCTPGDEPIVKREPPKRALPADALPEQPDKPTWGVIAALGALALMLLGAVLFFPTSGASYDMTAALVALSYPLLLAACICLMLFRGAKCRVLAWALLIPGAAIYAFSSAFLTLYASRLQRPPFMAVIRQPLFSSNLNTALLIAALTGIIALLIALFHRGAMRKKLSLSAWLSALLIALVRLINARQMWVNPAVGVFQKIAVCANIAGAILCVVLLTRQIYWLMTLKQGELITGTGAKVWFTLCILATAGVAAAGLVTRTAGVASALTAAAGVAGYILLLRSRRAGFPVIVLVITLNLIAGVVAAVSGYRPSVANALIPLVGLINPLITWLVIRRWWGEPIDAERRHSRDSSTAETDGLR